MDFSRTQISGLLNNVSHEKAKFSMALQKVKTLLEVIKDHKLIQTHLNKLILTTSPQLLFENINYSHPIIKILQEFLQKLEHSADGAAYFSELVKQLIDRLLPLLESGIKPKRIADSLCDVELKFRDDNTLQDTQFTMPKDAEEYIKKIVEDDCVSDLLISTIKAVCSYDQEKIRITKVPTGSPEDSYVVNGIVLNNKPEGKIQNLENTSTGIFNCALDINRTELKGTVLFKNSAELLSFSKDEVENIKKKVGSLNVNVIIISGTINDTFLEFADKRNLMVLKIFNKYDLKRLCDSLGGSIYNSLGDIKHKGMAKKVYGFSDGGHNFTAVVGEGQQVQTIVLKNSLRQLLDEMERKILCVLKCLQKCDKKISLGDQKESIIKQLKSEKYDAVVMNAVTDAIDSMKNCRMIPSDQILSVKYALGFLSTILEIDDYLVASRDKLNVQPPSHAGHWDEDH